MGSGFATNRWSSPWRNSRKFVCAWCEYEGLINSKQYWQCTNKKSIKIHRSRVIRSWRPWSRDKKTTRSEPAIFMPETKELSQQCWLRLKKGRMSEVKGNKGIAVRGKHKSYWTETSEKRADITTKGAVQIRHVIGGILPCESGCKFGEQCVFRNKEVDHQFGKKLKSGGKWSVVSDEEFEAIGGCASSERETELHSPRPRRNGYSLPASTKEPEEREFVVDSGASMHTVSKTLTLLSWRPWRHQGVRRRWWRRTARCKPEKKRRYMSNNWTYSSLLCFFKKTPAVLSLEKLCEEHGYTHHCKKRSQTTRHQKGQEHGLQYIKLSTTCDSWNNTEFFLYNAFICLVIIFITGVNIGLQRFSIR